ncbi:hypothetical protein C8A05DRAFT_45298 [Staphylotrichum tortipilum]|uniref:Uncharacterized protein n=1 Tax=Staphylotrichum tortipilum TaxID=2831512 RepID=A0AAN6RSY5_9PEZI|nr:hypothetical protein C8A05DRAFT_45298 [Staphylotrichum longicolle]
MSYGTGGQRPVRRKASGEEDPNVIPRTAPLGFLGRLPFKIVGSLRYKPSAANLREHPGGGGVGQRQEEGEGVGGGEGRMPLLGGGDEDDGRRRRSPLQKGLRARSDTTNSGDTSASYRSMGDLFPSDGEGDEDAVPLDDEFTVALERVDDRGSTKTRSSKGKRPADRDRGGKDLSRTVSRSTMSSTANMPPDEHRVFSHPASPTQEGTHLLAVPSMEDLQREEEDAEREEREERERRRRAAERLARERGLDRNGYTPEPEPEPVEETKDEAVDSYEEPTPTTNGAATTPTPTPNDDAFDDDYDYDDEQDEDLPGSLPASALTPEAAAPSPPPSQNAKMNGKPREEESSSTFVPARLPYFG